MLPAFIFPYLVYAIFHRKPLPTAFAISYRRWAPHHLFKVPLPPHTAITIDMRYWYCASTARARQPLAATLLMHYDEAGTAMRCRAATPPLSCLLSASALPPPPVNTPLFKSLSYYRRWWFQPGEDFDKDIDALLMLTLDFDLMPIFITGQYRRSVPMYRPIPLIMARCEFEAFGLWYVITRCYYRYWYYCRAGKWWPHASFAPLILRTPPPLDKYFLATYWLLMRDAWWYIELHDMIRLSSAYWYYWWYFDDYDTCWPSPSIIHHAAVSTIKIIVLISIA